MKPKRVATLNAGKFEAVLHCVKIPGSVLLMSLVLSLISCDKNDDFETVGTESPVNDLPPDNEPLNADESIIIYTDIEPDFTSQNPKDFYNLDLNNDQIIDFTIKSDFDYAWGVEWLVIFSNRIAENGILSVAPWSHTVPLNSGKEILNLRGYSNGENYERGGNFSLGNCYESGPNCLYDWNNKVDKYLGLQIIINGQEHYGWVRMDVTNFIQWVVKDYAYNATPNKPILAGQRN